MRYLIMWYVPAGRLLSPHARAHASLLGHKAKVNDVDSLNEIDEEDDIKPFDDTNFYTKADALL